MKKRFSCIDVVIWILAVACLTLAITLTVTNPLYAIPAGVIILIVAVVIAVNIRAVRKATASLIKGLDDANSDIRRSLSALGTPVLVLTGDHIMWYNSVFKEDVLGGVDACLRPVHDVFPMFSSDYVFSESGQILETNGKTYTAFGCGAGHALWVIYLVNDTRLRFDAEEYALTRPSVLHIAVDTYDEILKELKDSEKASVTSRIDLALEQFIGSTSGFMRHTSSSRYVAVVEERHMEQIVKSRFEILDTVRAIGGENVAVTLSIGVGRAGKTMRESDDWAAQALDMALGRGGDQAAVKSAEGFEFYGGVSRSIEKRSKVRSRIIATALKDLIDQSENVMVMGHRLTDLDAIGAAIGVMRMCKICDKPSALVVNEKNTLAENLIAQYRDVMGAEYVITPQQAEDYIEKKTLLIVVDTHMKQMLESTQLYEKAKNVVVIDHHRKGVGHIDDAVIFYHEPAASSASELVAEMLQYVGYEKETKPTQFEAQALLAGIMLDTRSFSIHTGVRTFEAAAFLRRLGAKTPEVKKLFNVPIECYAYKAQLVTEAEIFLGCAIVVSETLPTEMAVVIPQAANDLLTIDGVEASFVAVDNGSQISISARSMGAVNVQIIMEQLGGGGHLTMAGAQLKNTTLADAKQKLIDAVAEYRNNQPKLEAQ